ncbi:MAG: UvrD-helicase domain-containing protein [Deltaproteobacteria bacterium]|jgi:DNA helicase-2/ATP-dependent DNA helicase PcrA|nr:UvrD-helicase domain-containing protein [Deltaproteobacteria bacterium]
MDFLEGLNPGQKEAAEATEGAVRVVAGPGTGKTRTLTARYCHLVSDLGIRPRNILCATFTNKAAQEMKARVRALLGDMDLGLISTFHSFCRLFLKDEIGRLKLPGNFVIIDPEDQKEILAGIFSEMGLTLKDLSYREAIDDILEARKLQADSYVADFLELNNENIKKRFQKEALDRDSEIFLRYVYEQKKCFSLDFNDLINFATYILKTVPEVRERWRDRIEYLMIDEFQDVSLRQYSLGRSLSEKHGNIFIVGDPDQTIYTWRGAHHKIFSNFPDEHPGCRTVVLSENYRSTPEILETAGTLIERNRLRLSKDVFAVRGPGSKPVFYHARDENDEARWIARKIQRIASRDPVLKNTAVLLRAHYLTRSLEHALVKEKIPYRILCGTEFYHRVEIKDALCYLRMLSSADDAAFRRVINSPPRGIGKKSMEKIRDFASGSGLSLYEALKSLAEFDRVLEKKTKGFIGLVEDLKKEADRADLLDLFQAVLDRSGYEAHLRLRGDNDRLDNLAELKRSVGEFAADPENGLEDFLQSAALFTDLDRERRDDAVQVMTAHTAKGLEFKSVFIPGLSEGIFPSGRADGPEDMEEERRLCYVAMTRAKRRLYLSFAEGVNHDGQVRAPSRFLKEIRETIKGFREHDLEVLKEGGSPKKRPAGGGAGATFKEGDRVEHPAFGEGTIVSVDRGDDSYLIKFDALKTARSIGFETEMKALGP